MQRILKTIAAGLATLAMTACGQSVEERIALLEPSYKIVKPEGDGPFPVVLLFHGCGGLVGADGPKEIMDRYAAAATEVGYAALIVDSFTPRGITFGKQTKKVCSGRRLLGGKRAGDVVASLAYAMELPYAEPDGFVLAGWSHGGWTVMDAMVSDLKRSWPRGLQRPPADLYDHVAGVYLTYPYCGFPAKGRKEGWSHPIPAHIVVAGNDIVAKPKPCEEAFANMARSGVPFEITRFETMTHAFDEEDQTPTSPFVYDPEATEEALDVFRDFLTGRAAGR